MLNCIKTEDIKKQEKHLKNDLILKPELTTIAINLNIDLFM